MSVGSDQYRYPADTRDAGEGRGVGDGPDALVAWLVFGAFLVVLGGMSATIWSWTGGAGLWGAIALVATVVYVVWVVFAVRVLRWLHEIRMRLRPSGTEGNVPLSTPKGNKRKKSEDENAA